MKTHVRKLGLLALICLFVFGTGNILAQDVTDPSTNPLYDSVKASLAEMDLGAFSLQSKDASKVDQMTPIYSPVTESSCFIPVDGSFTAIPRNDDGSYGPINLPFSFNLYGTNYTRVWINTNGNITFTGPVWTYSPYGFPYGTPMVAPFWGDVDTRSGGMIYYKLTSSHLIVTWNGVGYYYRHTEKLNTFQAIIGTNADELTGIGQNVSLRYADMQWTTGDASGGYYGFGGIPATVGINKGGYSNYIQIGRFNQNNSFYDGPGGAHDGVHYLDYQCVAFNVSNAENIPPSFTGLPSNNTISLTCGEIANYTITAIAPEVNQDVTVSVNTYDLCNTVAIVNGSNVSLSITGSPCNSGTHTISITATDNGVPVESTTQNLTVIVEDCCVAPTINCPEDITVYNDLGQCGAYVTYPAATATGTPAPEITYSHASGSFFPVGTTTVMCTATNECGTASCSFDVRVVDNEPPVITAPEPISVVNDPGYCGAVVALDDPAVSDNCGIDYLTNDAGYEFPVGTTIITWTAGDIYGNTTEITQEVSVSDTEAPTISLIEESIDLWPPNHKYKSFSIDDFLVDVSDNCSDSDFAPYISMVSSDEPENANGNGDGNTYNDMVISDDGQGVDLRAERSGSANGRVYTIYINATDEYGNLGEATCQVTVPKSKNATAVDDGPVYWVYFGHKYSILADSDIIESNSLEQNIPNPFNESTQIDFKLDRISNVDLTVYNIIGQKIKTLVSGISPAGSHSVIWNATSDQGNSVFGGVYVYILKVDNNIYYKKMILMR